ncbi:MAG: DUF58 domain-containing protein, partial [Micromonosporaceae bacterium]
AGATLSLGRAVPARRRTPEVAEAAVVGGLAAGLSVALPEAGSVTVGRGADCDLVLDDPEVSRTHASLTAGDGQVAVADRDSRNGVGVRGHRIAEAAPLADGDTAQLGETMISVRHRPPADARLTPAAGVVRFNRPPRILPPRTRPEVEIPAEPEQPRGFRFPFAMVLLPLLLAGLLYAFLPGSWYFLIFLVSAGAGGADGGPRSGLTGSGWTVLAGGVGLAVAGLALGYPTLTRIGLAGLVALAVAVAFVLVGARLAVSRSVAPDRITVGEAALARIEMTNTAAPMPVPVPPVKPGARQTLAYPITATYRGLVRVGPVILDRRDPLGLLRRSARLAGETTLWVHPRVHQVRPLPIGVVPDFEGRLTEQAPRGSMAFSSLREYAPGDDPRQIHWRSTARLGTLVVREHVDTNEPSLSIVLDTRSSVLDGEAFEAAVELAASIALASQRHGHAVRLEAVGEDLAAVRAAGGVTVLDRLAAIRRSDGDVAGLLRLVERVPGGGALVVLSGDESGLAARLAAQRHRFSRVVVLLLGPAATATGPAATATRPAGPAARATGTAGTGARGDAA